MLKDQFHLLSLSWRGVCFLGCSQAIQPVIANNDRHYHNKFSYLTSP